MFSIEDGLVGGMVGKISSVPSACSCAEADRPAVHGRRHGAGCVSSFGGSPRRQEIGLANATAIASLEVWWPTSGLRQTFSDVPLDGFVRITEGRSELEELHPARIDLAAEH